MEDVTQTRVLDHPIFGRAEEDQDRTLLLEGQLHRFCDAIINEWDRLDDFLPPLTEGQAAEDWRGDLNAATRDVRAAERRLRDLVKRAELQRHKPAA